MALQPLFQKHEIPIKRPIWKATISFPYCYFKNADRSLKILLSNAPDLSPDFRWSLSNAELFLEVNKTVKKGIQI